jgi:hypothetical protein
MAVRVVETSAIVIFPVNMIWFLSLACRSNEDCVTISNRRVGILAARSRMAQCNFPECTRRAIGGFEHHELGTALDRTPIINRTETVVWCAKHEYALQKQVRFPGRWLEKEDV